MTESALSRTRQFVTLGIDAELFAVPVAMVEEILDMRPLFRVPDAPPYLAGLIDVRGRSVPAIDLRLKLGLAPRAANDSTRILVLRIPVGERQLVIGLVADRVLEVAEFETAALESAPDIGARWRSDYIQAVARHRDNFVIIFDLERLFSHDDIAFLHPKAA